MNDLVKIQGQRAADACRTAKLSTEAAALARPEANVADYLETLRGAGLTGDAVALLAHALPKREAVWWACLAARSTLVPDTPPAVLAALEAAEAWVYQPTDERRRTAMARAQATDFKHPGVWAAVAAFWSGGSMSPPGLPVVPPADHLTAAAVDGAVTLAAVSTAPEHAQDALDGFIRQAIDIAKGGSGRLKAAG